MPHSSRRKPSHRLPHDNKLVQVPLGDGWTTVSRKHKATSTNVRSRAEDADRIQASASSLHSLLVAQSPKVHERLTPAQIEFFAERLRYRPRPFFYSVIRQSLWQADYTLEEVSNAFAKKLSSWKASPEAAEVRHFLSESIGHEKLRELTTVALIGSGSFSCDISNTAALWQLVAFTEIAAMIQSVANIPEGLKFYAQEPGYNDVDRAFLAAQGIEVMETPQIFNMTGRQSFVMIPHVQLEVWTSDMRLRKTGLILGNEISSRLHESAGEDEMPEKEELLALLGKYTTGDAEIWIPDLNAKDEFREFLKLQKQQAFPHGDILGFYGLHFYWAEEQDLAQS